MTPQVKLIVTKDKSSDKTYSFSEPAEYTVGRSTDCDIQLPVTEEQDVSRHHCLFEIEPPRLWIQDLDSKNGTYVNDLRITNSPDQNMYELRDGDEVRVGHYVIEVLVEGTEVLDDLKYSSFANIAWAP
ncbi:MAG: FHA domain-containing protein [Gemmatales bacterium]